jgi:predicted HTH transcriptional regulator
MVLSEGAFREEFPGEGDYVEFKQGVSVARVQEAAVAFSNADGGVLVAGITARSSASPNPVRRARTSIRRCARHAIRAAMRSARSSSTAGPC